jgi:hypothetical protein
MSVLLNLQDITFASLPHVAHFEGISMYTNGWPWLFFLFLPCTPRFISFHPSLYVKVPPAVALSGYPPPEERQMPPDHVGLCEETPTI